MTKTLGDCITTRVAPSAATTEATQAVSSKCPSTSIAAASSNPQSEFKSDCFSARAAYSSSHASSIPATGLSMSNFVKVSIIEDESLIGWLDKHKDFYFEAYCDGVQNDVQKGVEHRRRRCVSRRCVVRDKSSSIADHKRRRHRRRVSRANRNSRRDKLLAQQL